MNKFKERWEIKQNWQLIHPFIGIIAVLFSAFLLSKNFTNLLFANNETITSYIALATGILVFSYVIIKGTLWCFNKLKNRWKVDARWEFIAIFIGFAITGSTAGKLSTPVLDLINVNASTTPSWLYWPIRIVIIFPLYQILLVCFGWLLGQSKFFTPFAKKMASRMGLGFLFKKK